MLPQSLNVWGSTYVLCKTCPAADYIIIIIVNVTTYDHPHPT